MVYSLKNCSFLFRFGTKILWSTICFFLEAICKAAFFWVILNPRSELLLVPFDKNFNFDKGLKCRAAKIKPLI